MAQKIQNKLVNYPNSQIVVLAETPNAIVHYQLAPRERLHYRKSRQSETFSVEVKITLIRDW